MLDCNYRKYAKDGKRLIGSGSLISPYVITGAAHANILTGSRIVTEGGEQAIVLGKLKGLTGKAASGKRLKKEAIAAFVDRPLAGFTAPYRTAQPVTFAAGADTARIEFGPPLKLSGYPSGRDLHVNDIDAATLTILRTDGRTDARTYDPDDPALWYLTLNGDFRGIPGMSGGPLYIDGKVSSAHWSTNEDDFLGWGRWLDKVFGGLPTIINRWTHKGGKLAEECCGIAWAAGSRTTYAWTIPQGPNLERDGHRLAFRASLHPETLITQKLRIMTAARKRTSIQVDFVASSEPTGAILAVEAKRCAVSLGGLSGESNAVHDLRVYAEAVSPGMLDLINVDELRLRSSGSINDVELRS